MGRVPGKGARLDLGELNPKQKLFCQARTRYVAYGGARGGGKSHVLRVKAVGGACAWPGIRILIVRREYPELEQTIILPIRAMVPPELATYNGTMRCLFFANGSMIKFGHYGAGDDVEYKDLPFHEILEIGGQVYGFGNDGGIYHFDRAYRSDDEKVIDCYAETGAMDFGRDWQLKYSPMLFVAIRPEHNARIYVTVESNRRGDYPDKLVSANLSTLAHVDFAHFSFITNRKPQVRRLKLKVKKAAFYQIIYKSADKTSTGTVIETDVRLRYAGVVK